MILRVTWLCCVGVLLFVSPSMAIAQEIGGQPIGLMMRRNPAAMQQNMDATQDAANTDEDLPDEALDVIAAHEKEAAEIRKKAEQEISTRRTKTIKTLQEIQDKYTKNAKLDEAVAIREKIRKLRFAHLKPLPNPGTMQGYVNRLGQSFYFDLKGSTNGGVWGTGVYTYDSSLAAAAVHAGVLKAGQRGTIKVTMLRSSEPHVGSTSNGVQSADWGIYQASYLLETPEGLDVQEK